MKPGKFLALDAESLVLGQMPVKNIEFDGRHCIEIACENLGRLIVAGDIDQQTAPGETRLIVNPDSWQVESLTIAPEQLQKSLQTAHGPHNGGRHETRLLVSNFQTITF